MGSKSPNYHTTDSKQVACAIEPPVMCAGNSLLSTVSIMLQNLTSGNSGFYYCLMKTSSIFTDPITGSAQAVV